MNPSEKAIALSYVLSELLAQNLDIAVHEMKVSNHPNAGQMYDKFCKLKSSNNNAFRVLNKTIGDNGLDEIKESLSILLEDLWD
jgi:hypothetical protein